MYQLLEGLRYLHDKLISHRGEFFKQVNVFERSVIGWIIRSQGEAKISSTSVSYRIYSLKTYSSIARDPTHGS